MKNKIPNVQTIITETSSFLLIILFAYSGVSKLLEFQNFQAQLGQSPLLSAYTGFISYTLIGVEFLLVALLAIPKCRYLGLLGSYGLMLVFTFYIMVILNYSSFIPCSCGGILENMSWKEHLIFNTIFSILPVIPLVINTNKRKKLFVLLAIIMAVSLNTVVILYLKSEKTLHSENPFIRRFIQGAANKIAEINLENFSKYLAGTDGKTIYLGDYKAPLYLVAVDTALTKQQQIKIQLEREDFPFASVQIRIAPPYFFLMDGTVPVMYRGKLTDWKGKLIFSNNNYYFSKAEILNANNIVFRAQQQKNFENILGIFHFDDSLKVDYKPQLLQKQIDGFFDTDGSLLVDKTTNKFIYTYYYRNQFIVTDDNLQLLHRQNTIDTTTKAKLKVVYLKETKQRKIASIPTTVNQITAVSNNLLFINSTLRGKFEPIEMWKQASIVDVYDIQSKTYLSSIYVYHANKEKLKAMLVINNNLYCLIGNQLHQYQLSKKHFKTPNRN